MNLLVKKFLREKLSKEFDDKNLLKESRYKNYPLPPLLQLILSPTFMSIINFQDIIADNQHEKELLS